MLAIRYAEWWEHRGVVYIIFLLSWQAVTLVECQILLLYKPKSVHLGSQFE
jgi:hypothetical protein